VRNVRSYSGLSTILRKSNSTGDDVCVRKCLAHMALHIEFVP
jgi:hypothetical protein